MANAVQAVPSARRAELLEAAYAYVLAHGLSDLSLRPLATAIGSSPRVLLYLFGSKAGLIRALLGRARMDELAALRRIDAAGAADVARSLWAWLADPAHRGVLTLWLETYARSVQDPAGPWTGFAEDTVRDWLDVLAPEDPTEATVLLAVLRGALIDLLATGDLARTTAAVERFLGSGR